jgi:hypothetical protein
MAAGTFKDVLPYTLLLSIRRVRALLTFPSADTRCWMNDLRDTIGGS